MPKFQTLKDFINTIYRDKELLSQLFDKRSISLRLDEVLNAFDDRTEERLPKLIDNEMITISGNTISIDDLLADFFANFLGAETVIDIGKAKRVVDEIKDNQQYFLNEKRAYKKEDYLRAIKQALRKAGKVIVQQIRLLQINIEQVYKTEKNLKNKLSKLEKFEQQLDIIRGLHGELNRILKDDIFFKNAVDNELQDIVIDVRIKLEVITDNLVNIQANIVRYLAKARQQNVGYEHLQRVKALKDSADLRAKSNIDAVLANEYSLFLNGKIDVQSKVSLHFLQTDDGYKVILNADKKRKSKHIIKAKLAPSIDQSFFDNQSLDRPIISIQNLKNAYDFQGGDLFTFVQNYNFGHPVSYDKRLTLFCKMISLYHREFVISDEMQVDNNQVSYAKIYLKSTQI